jgi:hypothetical protein
MRNLSHSLPTLAVSVAALLFVAWISLSARGRESLYAETPPAIATGG